MKVNLFPKRKSVRRFTDRAIEKSKLDQFLEFSKQLPILEKNIERELIFVTDKEWIAETLHSFMLSYGKIIAAPYLLLPFYEDNSISQYELGFQIEHLVLKATELELGTCWIEVAEEKIKARLFEALTDVDIAEKLFVTPVSQDLKQRLNDKVLRVAVLIGYPSLKRIDRIISNAVRMECKANARRSVDSFVINRKKKDFPPILLKILEHAVLAPSARNRQPWRVRITDDGFDLGGFEEHEIDLGIFMAHLKISMEHYSKPFKFKRLNETGNDLKWFGSFTLK